MSGWFVGKHAAPPAQGVGAQTFHAPGATVPRPATVVFDVPSTRQNASLIVVCIIALGALIAVPAFVTLLEGASLLHIAFATAGGVLLIGYAIDLALLLIGIGLILRKERARVLCLVLAVISLVFLVIRTPDYLNAISPASHAAASATSLAQRDLAAIRADPTIPAADKQQDIASLRLRIDQLTADQAVVAGDYSVGRLVIEYLLILTPLVFLTRPAVKREFS